MYEDIFNLKVNGTGTVLISTASSEIGLEAPKLQASGKYSYVTANIDVNIKATLTGRAMQFSDGSLAFQIQYTDGYGFILEADLNKWSKAGGTSTNVQKTQNLLNELISYNQQILENNLMCARGLELATESTIVLPIEYRKNLYTLQKRLNARNESIKQSGHVENVQEGTSPNFSVYNDSLVNFMNSPGIGVIPVIVYVIVGCIISAASAAVAWQVFKAMHAESKADFKFSNDLTANLLKYLPKEIYNQLMAENAENERKAQEAIDAASGGSFMKNIKMLGLGVLGFIAVDKLYLSKKQNS